MSERDQRRERRAWTHEAARPARAGGAPLKAWLALFRAMRIYHRYEVVGLERLLTRDAALLVGYHGRPLAYDLCMLSVTLYERLGYLPHGVVHRAAYKVPIMKWVAGSLGFLEGDGGAVAEAARRGEHILVQPGGTREGCRSFRHRYKVDWGDRTGYLKLAVRHALPIIPIAASGIDDGYIGLNDGYALGKRLRVPFGLPLWVGLGPAGLWPLSPPFPIKITQFIGDPIDPQAEGPIDLRDRAALLRLHRKVGGAVQSILNRANP
jgi:1-acyl-sn-glycerol-3-phosphate acyltransferase